ncbi:receptor-like protein 7 [Cicer arietinum]|uniref:Receptor-like protein 39 n=1 Tax=Cicer arietinum TaxID=3827 RepID=A0A1S2XGN3_CICAR|nr:receptor-like protein 39 [Cicer arietinum]
MKMIFLWLSLLPFCLINLSINIIFVTSHCLGHQQSLLLQLKNNLIFNSTKSTKLVDWDPRKDCCEWNGVTCNNKGHVIALDLSHEFIFGQVETNLFNLKYLQSLNVAYNDFHSEIHQEFQTLNNLRYLNLSSAGFVGHVPIEIFQIPSLQVLDVSYNLDLRGSLPNFPHQLSLHNLNLSHTNFSGPLPKSIHNLSQLFALDLSNCQFNGTLPNSISNLTQLVHLDLSFNNFIGPLPSFNNSKSLKVLSLNHNDFNGTIPSSHFEGLINLTSIDLGDNSFYGRAPSSLFRLQSLQQLMLYYNKFEGVLEEFPNASWSLLEMLDLSGNNFEGPIPMSMFKLKRLQLLQLTKNKFNGTIQLDVIGRLQNLFTLDLGHNKLFVDHASIRDGHDASSSFPNLKTLWLPSCNLRSFPNFLKYKSSLLYLDLSNNQISGAIPNWIWRFESMVVLNVSYNSLTSFEGPLHNLSSNLFKLDLHSNQLQGLAPTFLKNAIYLDYSSNKFTSISLKDIESHMPFLYFLSLSNNSFHGTIHESFCNISGLRALDLSHNSFNGKIPLCLTKRSNTLRLLSLSGNQLNDHISDAFTTSCDLRFLDLSGNLLSGTIPKSLSNCKHLQVLNLGNNHLIDRFPCFLNKISSLRVMILRSNKLHGHIECPNNNEKWETLRIVDLAANNFNGTLPPSLLQSWKALMLDEDKGGNFGHLFFNLYDNFNPMNVKTAIVDLNSELQMKLAKFIEEEPPYLLDHIVLHIFEEGVGLRSYEDSITIVNKGRTMNLVKIFIAFTSLDFSSNNFEGQIPQELMKLTSLHALNLSQNGFLGNIPSSISNLKRLESLDLSFNSLSGEIPNELASLTFLEVMNISYNHLVGKIPIGTQMQSFQPDSFIGNEGLFGPPLTQNSNGEKGYSPTQSHGYETDDDDDDESSNIHWNFLSVELGFTFGFGIFIIPIILWKRWRMWYSKKVDDMLYRIIPQLDFVHEYRGGKKYRTLRWKPY